MSDFGEIDDQVLQNIENIRGKIEKQVVLPIDNFHQLEQDEFPVHSVNEKNEDLIESSKNQEIIDNSSRFKLNLPKILDEKQQPIRNSPNKSKKINVQPPSQLSLSSANRQALALKIYDIDDEIQENVRQVSVKQQQQSVHVEHIIKFDKASELDQSYNNSFLEVKEQLVEEVIQKKQNVWIDPVIQTSKQEKIQIQSKQISSPLMFPSKIMGKRSSESKLTVGLFKQKQSQHDEYEFAEPSCIKKNLDSGLQITQSISTSRDEFSSRDMLSGAFASAQLYKKNKLQSLKPLKDVMKNNNVVVKLPSQHRLNQDEDKNSNIIQNLQTKLVINGRIVINDSQILNQAEFVKKPIGFGRILEGSLKRNKYGCKQFFLDYDFQTKKGKFLLSVKKMAFKLTSTYNISLKKDSFDEKSQSYLGCVEGNFSGSIFNVYAYNPNSYQSKQMVATIYYNSNCDFCSQKCRQIQIFLKSQDYRYWELEGTQIQKGKNLKELYAVQSNKSMNKITKYINKKPKWLPDYQVYAMNFGGKSKLASVKNTIIISEDDQRKQLILIAKQENNTFAFDVCYPFSPLIAVGLMITGFDFKLVSQ